VFRWVDDGDAVSRCVVCVSVSVSVRCGVWWSARWWILSGWRVMDLLFDGVEVLAKGNENRGCEILCPSV
jgi:hypothetical protein